MGIIKASKLIYDYIRRDEDDHVEEVKRAIDDLTLDINQGDFVAILGHNGSGKSTFAKQVNGILLPTDGTVWISGMNTADDAHIWDIRKTAGMVFQNPDNQIIVDYFNKFWVSGFPGLAIFTMAVGANFIGDGLRDLLDPKLRTQF